MAKKKDKNMDAAPENGEKSGGFGSALGTTLIIILIVVVWLAIFALLIKMDVGGVGTALTPLIKDVPGLKMILPGYQGEDEYAHFFDDYPYKSIEEAVEYIKDLEKEMDRLEDTNGEYAKKILELQAEIDRLKKFEDEYEDFLRRVKEFDVNVVYNSQAPSIEEYRKYYEEINPETAEEIYRQVIEQLQYDDMIKQKADLLKNMKPGNAAKVLEEMTADLEYTCKILLCMKTTEATEIMNKMDQLFVARLLQTMHDMDEAWYKKIQSGLLQNQ
ncbi:MAG: hypothetical protein K6G45_06640 [Lachnospiraceae bacterium]|nr:hypothetical protein [Lachnospiraceae bacterium]